MTINLPRYVAGEVNHCPGCSRSQWHIGRTTAECVFCSTAIPLAEQTTTQSQRMHSRGKGGGKISRYLPASALLVAA